MLIKATLSMTPNDDGGVGLPAWTSLFPPSGFEHEIATALRYGDVVVQVEWIRRDG